eukprot:GHVS01025053.1.p1 GENE.GHVS01025053.1~~GHVS01025053.1.p1  ORF type:complete len:252 (+),score=51.91 GHVS01025053.1:86-841(+)
MLAVPYGSTRFVPSFGCPPNLLQLPADMPGDQKLSNTRNRKTTGTMEVRQLSDELRFAVTKARATTPASWSVHDILTTSPNSHMKTCKSASSSSSVQTDSATVKTESLDVGSSSRSSSSSSTCLRRTGEPSFRIAPPFPPSIPSVCGSSKSRMPTRPHPPPSLAPLPCLNPCARWQRNEAISSSAMRDPAPSDRAFLASRSPATVPSFDQPRGPGDAGGLATNIDGVQKVVRGVYQMHLRSATRRRAEDKA